MDHRNIKRKWEEMALKTIRSRQKDECSTLRKTTTTKVKKVKRASYLKDWKIFKLFERFSKEWV